MMAEDLTSRELKAIQNEAEGENRARDVLDRAAQRLGKTKEELVASGGGAIAGRKLKDLL